MPIYPQRNQKGKWRVRIFVKGQVHNWVFVGTKKEAEAFEAHKRVELETAQPEVTRVVPTFSDFSAEKYKPHAKTHLKPNTWTRARYILATLIQHFGHLKLTEFTLEAIEAFERKRLASNNGPTTVNNELRLLHRILTYAQELDIPVNIPRWKPLRSRTSRAVKCWTEKEVGNLMTAVAEKSASILPIVVCLANTGMRCGEVLALTWEDVDLDEKEIRVQAKPEAGWSPKSDKWRTVPVNDALRPFLSHPGKKTDPVFPCPSTGHRYAHWPTLQFDRARKEAGLVGGPHTLRHTYASHFLKNHPDLYLLSRVLGHSHTRVTELYSHLLPDALAAARTAVSFTSPVGAAENAAKKAWGTKEPVVQKTGTTG
jgi:integrase